MPASPPSRTRRALLAAAVFSLALGVLAGGIEVSPERDEPPFNPDEAAKLADASFYRLALRGAWRDPAWSEGFYARTNPATGKLVFGGALALAGGSAPDLSLQRRFDALWRSPAELRREVPDGLLRAGRRASAFFGALACAAVALAVADLAGLAAGLAAALLLLGHAAFAGVSREALTDSLLLFWLALAPLVFASALRALRSAWCGAGDAPRWPALALRAVLAPALVVALAAGTKPNGGLSGAAYALSLAGAAMLPASGVRAPRRLLAAAGVCAASAALAFALFVATNPYLWSAPWSGLVEGHLVWRDWMLKQQLDPGGALHGTAEKLVLVAHATLRSGDLALVRMLGAGGRWLGLLLLACGVAALGVRILRAARGAGSGAAAVSVAAWALALAAGIGLWIPIVRMQYPLPVFLAVCVVQALGLSAGLRGAARAWRAFRRGEPAPWSTRRAAAAVAAAGAVFAALAPGSPLVDASLLHPLLVPDAFAGERLAGYRRGAAAHPDSALRRYHLAIAYGMRRRFADGTRELEAALARLPADAPDAGAQVLRADVLLGLAQYRAARGQAEASAAALAAYLETVAKLRDGMRSRDPFVRAEFDRVLARRREPSD